MKLEATVASLQAELDAIPSRSRAHDPQAWLPSSNAEHTLQSHRDAVTCVAFHPIFTSLASGSEDCTIKIWDWGLGELETTLKGHVRAVSDIDFGGPPGQTLLVSCSSDLMIKIWDPSKDYANVRTLAGHDHSVSAVRFLTLTNNLIVSASRDATLRIWDVLTGYCLRVIGSCDAWIRDVSPSVDGRWLVSGGKDHKATVWELSNGSSAEPKAVLIGHQNDIQCCVIAPPETYEHLAKLAGRKTPPAQSSSEFIATGSRDKTIKLWNARGGLIKTLISHDNWVRGLVFHPNGKYLLSVADDKTIRCWDLSQEARLVKTLEESHEHFVTCIRWIPPASSSSNIQCILATGSADSCVRVFR